MSLQNPICSRWKPVAINNNNQFVRKLRDFPSIRDTDFREVGGHKVLKQTKPNNTSR